MKKRKSSNGIVLDDDDRAIPDVIAVATNLQRKMSKDASCWPLIDLECPLDLKEAISSVCFAHQGVPIYLSCCRFKCHLLPNMGRYLYQQQLSSGQVVVLIASFMILYHLWTYWQL